MCFLALQSCPILAFDWLSIHFIPMLVVVGCILDDERARLYASIVNKGCAARFAFAAAIFGESTEALFWLQLPNAVNHLLNKLVNKSSQKAPEPASSPELDDTSMLSRITSKGKSISNTDVLVSDR